VCSFVMLCKSGPKKKRRTALKASWVFPLLILLILPALIATNLRNPVADIYTKTGEQMMRAKHWRVAQLCFSKAISFEPNQAWRHEKLGFLYFARAKAAKEPEKNLYFQKAIYHGQKATHLSPLDRALKSNLARMSSVWAADAKDGKMRFYRLKVADNLYMEALEAEPNNSLLWKESAQIAAALGQTDVAVQRFQRALKLHENDFESHRNLAILYRGLKRYPEALAHAEAALRLASKEQRAQVERLVEELKGRSH
jgi:tetratricopeptide (TPR) repeat protein